jgi:hypothetical protein
MSNGININYGSLQLYTPAIVMPVSSQIGAMGGSVTQYMQAAEGRNYDSSGMQSAYETANALMLNNAAYSAQQANSNSQFNNVAAQTAEYQANSISNQGKK